MKFKCIPVGELEVNCYLLTEGSSAVIIDPGASFDLLVKMVEEQNLSLKAIILTHGHFDHIGAVAKLSEKFGAPVYAHKGDEEMLTDNEKSLATGFGCSVDPCKIDVYLEDDSTVEIGGIKFDIYHTPGHSNGGVCLYTNGVLFTGDLLFKNSIGRFDRGDLRTELASLKRVMNTFDDETIVCAGHGESTTIGTERRYNPYIVNHIN